MVSNMLGQHYQCWGCISSPWHRQYIGSAKKTNHSKREIDRDGGDTGSTTLSPGATENWKRTEIIIFYHVKMASPELGVILPLAPVIYQKRGMMKCNKRKWLTMMGMALGVQLSPWYHINFGK